MVKLKDIAEMCKVSVATVSKALKGDKEISKHTIDLVQKTAKSMGYIPNASARSLKTNRSYNIGILFIDEANSGLKHEYFSAILNAFKVNAESRGYDITFISESLKNYTSYYEHARYRNVDGVVIACVDFKDPEVIRLVESEVPTVTIDYVYNNSTAIMSDNAHGVEELVRYAYELGHRQIAFITGEADKDVTKKRLAGFYKTTAELKLNVPLEYIKHARYITPGPSGLMTRELLALPVEKRPTCILYPDDYAILAGITEIEKHGLTVGKDISIAGYDGSNLSKLFRPILTTYKQNTEEIGRLASEKLIDLIENPRLFIPEQLIVSGEIQKGSTILALIDAREASKSI
ncbi:MAG: LacI family DNA-binding transcriptional regulator [Bacilli bacterium]|jgi:LacI family transcriptional regulator|nr:LacI family DNA-binding transcriptional regulator [Bacilli bacterium]MDD4344528.1 LacI family DNA-binding transcriptional regulator [Bacilli bacterium]MDD4520422.1 LacI family DNA-binding transcriptional regulator [Bacilli bacterium]MDY0399163.1 LacI family DNA-binding transcriptional regulator [Bacilli bacterium]